MSLFEEIQTELIGDIPLSRILRKAKVLAYELGNEEFKVWVESELTGYSSNDRMPPYRRLKTLVFGDFVSPRWKISGQQIPDSAIPEKWKSFFEEAEFFQPVAEIENIINSNTDKDRSIRLSIPADLFGLFHGKVIERAQCVRAWKLVSEHQLVGILDSTRNALLSFILELGDKYPQIKAGVHSTDKVPDDLVSQIFQVNIQGDANMIVGRDYSSIQRDSMTTFDQRHQQVNTQYNVAGDITFNGIENVQEFTTELQKLRGELARASETDAIDEEIITDADYQITKAIQAASKTEPVKSTVLGHLTKAKEYVDGIEALIKVGTAIASAISIAHTLFP